VTDTFWRVDTGRNNQSEQIAQLQQSSMKVCGLGSRQSGGGVSDSPAVKAYYGVLPAQDRGMQFETNVAPYSVNRTQGGLVTWPRGWPGVIDEPSGMVCIPITAITLRY
jgi:hypothetical protein